jgi:hypothetical protein
MLASLAAQGASDGAAMHGKPASLLEVYQAYRRYLDERVAFLEVLQQQGRQQEALTLLCVYLEGLAQRIYGKGSRVRGSRENFVRVLIEQGGEEQLALVDRTVLCDALRHGGDKLTREACAALAEVIEGEPAGSAGELSTIDEVLEAARPKLAREQRRLLAGQVWRGTLAAVAYDRFRNPLVHDLHAPTDLPLDNLTFRGAPVPSITFAVLYRALRRIGSHWMRLIEEWLLTQEAGA